MSRGRPKGSKNKPKIGQRNEQAVPLNYKDIKRQIRVLRKLKKDTSKKTEERREINEKIRELKKQLLPIMPKILDPIKEPIIKEILKKRPEYIRLGMNLFQYTVEQLQKHLLMIQDKPRLI